MINTTIAPLAETHFIALHTVLDAVARERVYLALLEAPALDETLVFYRKLLQARCSHVALLDDEVVGWCDVNRSPGAVTRHVGLLGIGLLPQARHMGLGRALLNATIQAAWQQGLTRIELNVREDNLNAIALYERIGFQFEGRKRNMFLIDGQYHNCHAMALLKDEHI